MQFTDKRIKFIFGREKWIKFNLKWNKRKGKRKRENCNMTLKWAHLPMNHRLAICSQTNSQLPTRMEARNLQLAISIYWLGDCHVAHSQQETLLECRSSCSWAYLIMCYTDAFAMTSACLFRTITAYLLMSGLETCHVLYASWNMNYFLVPWVLVQWRTDGQTDRQTDRKRCIRAHRA